MMSCNSVNEFLNTCAGDVRVTIVDREADHDHDEERDAQQEIRRDRLGPDPGCCHDAQRQVLASRQRQEVGEYEARCSALAIDGGLSGG